MRQPKGGRPELEAAMLALIAGAGHACWLGEIATVLNEPITEIVAAAERLEGEGRAEMWRFAQLPSEASRRGPRGRFLKLGVSNAATGL